MRDSSFVVSFSRLGIVEAGQELLSSSLAANTSWHALFVAESKSLAALQGSKVPPRTVNLVPMYAADKVFNGQLISSSKTQLTRSRRCFLESVDSGPPSQYQAS